LIDKARKRKQLRSIIERRSLMANDTAMAKDLMLFNPNLTKQRMIEESADLCTVLPIKGAAVSASANSCPRTKLW
jgi:hypothetical protein